MSHEANLLPRMNALGGRALQRERGKAILEGKN